jgi:hypothetical protein
MGSRWRHRAVGRGLAKVSARLTRSRWTGSRGCSDSDDCAGAAAGRRRPGTIRTVTGPGRAERSGRVALIRMTPSRRGRADGWLPGAETGSRADAVTSTESGSLQVRPGGADYFKGRVYGLRLPVAPTWTYADESASANWLGGHRAYLCKLCKLCKICTIWTLK